MVEEAGGKSSSHMDKIPEAVIPSGTWKYIQIQVQEKSTGKERMFVRGYEHHEYHSNILSTFENKELMKSTDHVASCPGGGRIKYDASAKIIEIYGYS
jgi:hypothetical protein